MGVGVGARDERGDSGKGEEIEHREEIFQPATHTDKDCDADDGDHKPVGVRGVST